MTRIAISATGTDIGKTYVLTGLLRYAKAHRISLRGIKPIESGFSAQSAAESDAAKLLEAQGITTNLANIQKITPWRFKAPLSPHVAAKLAGHDIDLNAVVEFCQQQSQPGMPLCIEGAGGVMVPINQRYTYLDLFKHLGCKLVLVVGSYLGTLSHTLTAIKSCQVEGVNIVAIVINEGLNSNIKGGDTMEALAPFVSSPLFLLPQYTKPNDVIWRDILTTIMS